MSNNAALLKHERKADKNIDIQATLPLWIYCLAEPRAAQREAVVDAKSNCSYITWAHLVELGEDKHLDPAEQGDAHSHAHAGKGYKGSIVWDIGRQWTHTTDREKFCVLETATYPLVLRGGCFPQENAKKTGDKTRSICPMVDSKPSLTKDKKSEKDRNHKKGKEEADRAWEEEKRKKRDADRKKYDAQKKPGEK